MSNVHRLAKAVLPRAWFERLRQSSDRWMIQCTRCQSEKSTWSVGGIRWGAMSYGKRIAAHCQNCGCIVAARIYYRKPAEETIG